MKLRQLAGVKFPVSGLRSNWHCSACKGPYALRPASQHSPQGWARNSALFVKCITRRSRSRRVECRPLPFSVPVCFRWSVLGCSGLSMFRQLLKSLSTDLSCRDRIVGLVVKASASRAEDPGFESRLRRDFSGSSHTSDIKIRISVNTLQGAWHYRASTRTGRPGVSILLLGEVESLICNFYLSLAARKIVWADPSQR